MHITLNSELTAVNAELLRLLITSVEMIERSYLRFIPSALQLKLASLKEADLAASRARGLAVDPEDIFLFPSVSNALRAVAVTCGLTGQPVAFEDPGYAKARLALREAGAVIRPVPVDDETMKKVAQLSGGQSYSASNLSELKGVYSTLQQQIGYETIRGDASTGWLRLGSLVLALAALAALLINRRLPN